MSKELVIAANRHEIKVAILEDDQLVEVFFQRANEYSLAGSIHKGRVTRVLPGMQSAFVDLGLERDTFLYVSDFSDEAEDFDRVSVTREPSRGERGDRGHRPPAQEPVPAVPEAADTEAPVERRGRASRNRPWRRLLSVAATVPIAASDPIGVDGDRGRRSRRRRGRGRGFPDSKYASSDPSRPPRFGEAAPAAETTSPATVSAPVMEDRPTAPSAGATDFSVLPGESLAKYSRSNIHPLDEAEEDEIRDLQETSAPVEPEMLPEITLAEIAEEAIEEPDDAPVAEESEMLAAEPEVEVLLTVEEIEAEMDAAPSESRDRIAGRVGRS